MELKEKYAGVFTDGKNLYTKNAVPGKKVYGERLVQENRIEYRQWDQFRSKLAASIKKGLTKMPIKKGSHVLYLGIAEGTTATHIAEIVGEKGLVFGIDVSARVMHKLLALCEERKNILPVLGDAKNPEEYKEELSELKFDILYQDIAQKNQAEIFLKNAGFLCKGGHGFLVLKGKSISQKESMEKIFTGEVSKLKKEFKILQVINLNPFEKSHAMVYCQKL